MSGNQNNEPRYREEVSLGRRLMHRDADVILTYDLTRKVFGARQGKVTHRETNSSGNPKVTVKSDNKYEYVVTRNGKEDYSTNWYNWKTVETVSY